MTSQGQHVATTWQIVDVNRPLLSVHQICNNGNIVVFGEHGGYVMNVANGESTHFGVEDNVYVMELLMQPARPMSEGFPRPGPPR